MSLPPLDLTLPTDDLRITAWPDPVIDEHGHDVCSAYVEQFWLPILGPTTLLFLRRVARGLDDHPEGFDLPLLDTARALGLGVRGGRNAPFLRAISRSMTFNLSRYTGTSGLEIRRRVPPLNRSKLERLPPALLDEHQAWARQAERTPTVEHERRRARRLALSLAELGEPDEAIERQLHLWKLHPALAHDALRWARERQAAPLPRSVPSPAPAAFTPVPRSPGSGGPPRPIPAPPRPVFTPTGDAA